MRHPGKHGLLAVAGLVAAAAPAFFLSDYHADVYRKLLIWVALALSYNFVFGIAGQPVFSHFAFAGLGAYGAVILVFKLGLPFVVALPLTVLLCAAVALAVAIPATRLEGFYLALATLAFAQLVEVVLDEGGWLTGGTGGIASYRLPPVLGIDWRGPWYTAVLVLSVGVILAVLVRLADSPFGRACCAVRDNAAAAAAMGVDVARTKTLAFAIASTLAGVAGIGYAFIDNVINPPVFGLDNTFLLLFMVIIGGPGSHVGAVVGAVLLYLAPFALEPLVGSHAALVFGVLVILAILFQPTGLAGLPARLGLGPRRA